MTRDSLFWWFSIIGAVLVGLAGSFSQFPFFSEQTQHVISLLAFIYGIVAGKMATSPLKGSNE